jgi:tight adherence protein B
MGALLGLVAGVGLLLIAQSIHAPRRVRSRRTGAGLLRDLIDAAGVEAVTPAALIAGMTVAGVSVFLLAAIVSQSLTISVAFGLLAAYAPVSLLRMRAGQRRQERRDLWPDVVDNLASAVRAGLSLPEAVAQLGVRGPEPLRGPFARFGTEYRATGRFDDCLDRLKASLADPVGDRIVEAVRLARAVGGSELGRLLRTLSTFLRADARTRAEVESRQSWTVNAARLAVSAPWVVLGFIALRPSAIDRYDSKAGVVVLTLGAAVCARSYRIMLRIGRLPADERVLR